MVRSVKETCAYIDKLLDDYNSTLGYVSELEPHATKLVCLKRDMLTAYKEDYNEERIREMKKEVVTPCICIRVNLANFNNEYWQQENWRARLEMLDNALAVKLLKAIGYETLDIAADMNVVRKYLTRYYEDITCPDYKDKDIQLTVEKLEAKYFGK